ncbi:metallophosphoesterase [Roseibium denhamense]|uniref:Calcineurin-like phosphoesterase domain-containing protein n=1 Tax=Roseibium denhamense TaxID=76305 RepID=A0ABY1NH19_9HYPH|nr:metallophosphoesterase [Roseibium denhamense]SMP09491.1 hypothetical protein SAMN06265374_1119 [Roseibium denhamense]
MANIDSSLDQLIPARSFRPGLPDTLPARVTPWPLDLPEPDNDCGTLASDFISSLAEANSLGPWTWPKKPIVFISDVHADAESLLRSLEASGIAHRYGLGLNDFHLTDFGLACQVVIGGDCLDKGPSNLDLLASLKALMDKGADTVLLAGNHDLRLLLGLASLGAKRGSLSAHMFVRMGKKVLPLMKEVFDLHVDPKTDLKHLPDEETCRKQMLPGKKWFKTFPKAAAEHLLPAAIDKELNRLRKKTKTFFQNASDLGLSARELYAAALKCRELFVDPHGDYAWFYQSMKAVHRSGSLLFVHAGIDDHMARQLSKSGPAQINSQFITESRAEPFTFYSGSLANLMRTKYRPVDHPLTEAGVRDLHSCGVRMLVHGHVNRHHGQELSAKQGLLHLEADITLDRHSRESEGLDGIGTGATIIHPDGNILGISCDYPYAKLFNPEHLHLVQRPLT